MRHMQQTWGCCSSYINWLSVTMSAMSQTKPAMSRQLGLFGATFMGLGSIVGTGIFVSIGIAAGIAGPWVMVAVIVAAIVATCNALSSAQLAAVHPVSGGTYEYGYRYISPLLGFSAGWLFVSAKVASAATAALGFTGYLLHLTGQDMRWLTPAAVAVVVLMTLLVAGGIRRSSLANGIIVSITLLGLMVFVLACLPEAMSQRDKHWQGLFASDDASPTTTWNHVFEACALMFVAYTGYGRIATMGEEVTEPSRTIPRAIILTLLISAALYAVVALVAVGAVGAPVLAELTPQTAAPLEAIAKQLTHPAIAWIVSLAAMTAMLGVLLNLILGISRVVLAMGRRGDLPAIFTRINARTGSPLPAVIVTGLLIAVLVSLGSIKLAWSFSAMTVLVYYAVTNLAAIRLPREDRRYPVIIAWLGLIACLLLARFVAADIRLMGAGWMVIGLLWHLWCRRTYHGRDAQING